MSWKNNESNWAGQNKEHYNNGTLGVKHKEALDFWAHSKDAQNRLPKILIEGRVNGTRPRGRPPKSWMDCIKGDCSASQTSLAKTRTLAQDRSLWRRIIIMEQMAG